MRPSPHLVRLLAIWSLLSLSLAIARPFDIGIGESLTTGWTVASITLLVAVLLDILSARTRAKMPEAQRSIPNSLSLGVDNTATLRIHNPSTLPITVEVMDHFPDMVEIKGLPRRFDLEPNAHATVPYTVRPLLRGEAVFDRISLRVYSRAGLWHAYCDRGEKSTVKIYPNFRSIANFRTLGLHQHVNHLGIHIQQKRGLGLDFHQLREFRDGDSMNQVDWKATSRMRKLISREYQDERDQDIIFLLDSGRRMHAMDGDLSHFDHVLNAFLLTSYVAIRQGDAVGLLSFAGDERWVRPQKGHSAVNTLLNHVYDLHSSTSTTDYIDVARRIINGHHKRSLVILITNLQDQDTDDLLMAVNLLTEHHAVIVASLRESFLDENLTRPIEDFEQALNYAGTIEYTSFRKRMLQRIRKCGVTVTDSLPRHLHIELINEYLAMKRRGVI